MMGKTQQQEPKALGHIASAATPESEMEAVGEGEERGAGEVSSGFPFHSD